MGHNSKAVHRAYAKRALNITVKYGVDSINKQVEDDFTFGDLQESDVFKAGLGFGDNTKALVEGIEQKRETVIPAGAMARI